MRLLLIVAVCAVFIDAIDAGLSMLCVLKVDFVQFFTAKENVFVVHRMFLLKIR